MQACTYRMTHRRSMHRLPVVGCMYARVCVCVCVCDCLSVCLHLSLHLPLPVSPAPHTTVHTHCRTRGGAGKKLVASKDA